MQLVVFKHKKLLKAIINEIFISRKDNDFKIMMSKIWITLFTVFRTSQNNFNLL